AGLKEGEEKGRATGLKEGRAAGLKEGEEKGRATGLKEGEEKGRKEGIIQVAANLLAILDDEQIASITGLPLETVRQLRIAET
ncbi:MAG: hypothetical protein ACE5GO_12795, partial [Anaerolineales bacterium]